MQPLSHQPDFKRWRSLSEINSPAKNIEFTFNGELIRAVSGQTVGAAILESGKRSLRKTRFENKPRGMFCGIGICFDCLVSINGVANQRACLVQVLPNMNVQTQIGSKL